MAAQGRNPQQLANLAAANYKAGHRDFGDALLAELRGIADTDYVSEALFATIYFAAGDVDAGFAALNKAYADKSRGLLFLQTSRDFDGHRSDPRYQDLLQKIGFRR
jgi:hypothetical protein